MVILHSSSSQHKTTDNVLFSWNVIHMFWVDKDNALYLISLPISTANSLFGKILKSKMMNSVLQWFRVQLMLLSPIFLVFQNKFKLYLKSLKWMNWKVAYKVCDNLYINYDTNIGGKNCTLDVYF